MRTRLPALVSALSVTALVTVLVTAPVTAATPALPAPSYAAQDRVPVAHVLRADDDPQVLAISVDALNPDALRKLGHDGAPNLWRLVDEGASTLNARTQVEQTVTLPNHTSMVTGRRIYAKAGGHGVTWNDDKPGHPATVQKAAGHGVASVFSVAHSHGRTTGLYASKTKFSLWDRSWPAGIDKVDILDEQDAALATAVRKDLLASDRDLTFLHLGGADKAGHAYGFMGPQYLAAVTRIDGLIGRILHAADTRDQLDDLTIVLTADHGGPKGKKDHGDRTLLADYRIPFAVWGPGIAAADLYDLNPAYRDPGKDRPGLRGKQPVRNGNLANVALSILGLDPVPGSLFGFEKPLVLSEAPPA